MDRTEEPFWKHQVIAIDDPNTAYVVREAMNDVRRASGERESNSEME